jgi:hypothetical protein
VKGKYLRKYISLFTDSIFENFLLDNANFYLLLQKSITTVLSWSFRIICRTTKLNCPEAG